MNFVTLAMALAFVATGTASAQSSPAPPGAVSEGLRRARACNGDNACVVRALEGHARTCAEWGLLAMTYRLMSRHHDARVVFDRYLSRCGARDLVPRAVR